MSTNKLGFFFPRPAGIRKTKAARMQRRNQTNHPLPSVAQPQNGTPAANGQQQQGQGQGQGQGQNQQNRSSSETNLAIALIGKQVLSSNKSHGTDFSKVSFFSHCHHAPGMPPLKGIPGGPCCPLHPGHPLVHGEGGRLRSPSVDYVRRVRLFLVDHDQFLWQLHHLLLHVRALQKGP